MRDPVSELRVAQGGEGQHRLAQDGAVVLDIVATEGGEGGRGGGAAAVIGFDDDADGAGWLLWTREVGPDQRMLRIELFGRAVEAVAVFGDGQADDADLRPGDGVHQGGAGIAGEHRFGERADDGHGFLGSVALDQRVEIVLRRQAVAHAAVGWQQPGAEDAPSEHVGALFHQVVGVSCHVGAVKAAQAEVNTPRRDAAEVKAGQPDRRSQERQIGSHERNGLHDGFSPEAKVVRTNGCQITPTAVVRAGCGDGRDAR